MIDSTPRPALVAASWFSLFVAMLSMSVPYMEFAAGKRNIELISEEFNVDGMASAVFALPSWIASATAVVLLLALVIKELAMSDAAVKATLNLSVAVVMLGAGAWLALLSQSRLMWMMNAASLDPVGVGP
jgi:hypothetical protein